MNKFYTPLFSLFALLLGASLLTACELYIEDEDGYERHTRYDRDRAYVISGQWEGDFGMFYEVVNPRTGRTVRYNANHSKVLFVPDHPRAYKGWGKQIDVYAQGPLELRYHYFYWEVRNGTLYLSYPKNHDLDIAIYNYTLSSRYFEGEAGNSHFAFSLHKSNFSDWNRFSGNYYEQPLAGWTW